MSTTIYNGFKLNKSFNDAYFSIIQYQPMMDNISSAELMKSLGLYIIAELDVIRNKAPNDQIDTSAIIKKCRQDFSTNVLWNRELDEENNFEYPPMRIQLFPTRDDTVTYANITGQLMSSRFDEYREAVGLVPFGYWNNSDPEDGVSDEDWEERGLIWDDILDRGNGSSFLKISATIDVRPNLWYRSVWLSGTQPDIAHAIALAAPDMNRRGALVSRLADEYMKALFDDNLYSVTPKDVQRALYKSVRTSISQLDLKLYDLSEFGIDNGE